MKDMYLSNNTINAWLLLALLMGLRNLQ